MKNVYEPNNEDVLAWVNGGTEKWPASDWDYYVMNGQNDDMVFDLANNHSCARRDFFVHALYYLVGEFYNEGSINSIKHNRINHLLGRVNNESTEEVKKWKSDTMLLLSKNMTLDSTYWLNFMFRDEI
ncbi:MAG TPA: hypothetical protein VM802_00745 [Chitinophaga sp.]|uniref:hypothetical protein n=1 Tax=Chitinophaga sp. TaxID=1869181 RepID=UPI002BA1EA58|nr:hypothetical protein [Chitinophaga sp.]HVI43358.1 hypothetical protein [Chitinophaga sp.]